MVGLLCLLDHYIERHTGDDSFYSFDNAIFSFQHYVWDCKCDPSNEEDDFHEPNCPLGEPNFLYKPTNFFIERHKHIGRYMEYSDNISVEEFHKIINTCIISLGTDTNKYLWKDIKRG